MEVYFMKQKALDYMKANMDTLYVNYYREKTNKWIYELFDYDPFELFITVDDINLNKNFDEKGKMELENCKILYSSLKTISRSQATDERLWAGLCNGAFYEFVRNRWSYPMLSMNNAEQDAHLVLARFFFPQKETIHRSCFTNTLSKFWWTGSALHDSSKANEFEYLDALGPERFYSKVHDVFYSNNFSSNPSIVKGICKGWHAFTSRGIKFSSEKHFRPALKYMNAIGGGVLLDVLSENEIAELFSEYISSIYKGNDSNPIEFVDDTDDFDENENSAEMEISDEIRKMQEYDETVSEEIIDEIVDDVKHIGTFEEKNNITNIINDTVGAPEFVTYGTSVVVYKGKTNEQIEYGIPKSEKEGQWFTIMFKLLNKKIGDKIFIAGSDYTVLEIKW